MVNDAGLSRNAAFDVASVLPFRSIVRSRMSSAVWTRVREFLSAGRPGTLFSALAYFDICFAVWVLNAALVPYIAEEFEFSAAQKGALVSVPVLCGAFMRIPFGLVAQYLGRKTAAQINMALVVIGLLAGMTMSSSYERMLVVGAVLGMAGASFGVALSLGAGWYPAEHKGLAMGIAGAGNSGAVWAMLFAPPLAESWGWRAVYGFSILPMIVVMIAVQFLAEEPPDREDKALADYLKILWDRDAWVFSLIYMVTFGGYIGLTSFLPTLFHDQYGVPRDGIGAYAAGIILAAGVLRVAGGWLSDRVGGIRLLLGVAVVVVVTTLIAASGPANPWAMTAVLIVCFAAMGAGNGAVFQLVPLRFRSSTAVAGSMIGEVGALAGGLLPNAMGLGRTVTGGFSLGFLAGTVLTIAAAAALLIVMSEWTTSWVGKGRRARNEYDTDVVGPAAAPAPALVVPTPRLESASG
jgi:NNP family nitrate/nitrite transporter-like MFS transporter